MDLGTAKTKAIQLINEYSTNGSIESATTNADYLLRMNNLADAAQKEIAQFKRIHASYAISQSSIPNLIGTAFNQVQYLPGADCNVTAAGAKSYYFEVDRESTVYVEEETTLGVWNILSTITVPSGTSSFTPYKGHISASNSANKVRLRFSGNYPYSLKNTALYAYQFPAVNDIPNYRPFVKYQMPTNFAELNKIIREYDSRQYENTGDFFWEGRRTLVLNYDMVGSFNVLYYAYPQDITSSTPESYVFEIEPDAQELIPYYIAANIIMDDNTMRPVAITLLNLYQNKLANLNNKDHKGIDFIENTSGW